MTLANIFMPTSALADDADFDVLGTIDVARGPIGDIAVSANGRLVVTNYGDNSVAVLDADTLTVDDTVTVDGEPFAVAVTDDRAYVSTASASYDSVPVIDTDSRRYSSRTRWPSASPHWPSARTASASTPAGPPAITSISRSSTSLPNGSAPSTWPGAPTSPSTPSASARAASAYTPRPQTGGAAGSR